MTDILENFAYLYGKPTSSAKLKAKPEHFIVKEELGFDFTGSGEHVMVKVRKTGENTMFVANELARYCGVKSKDIGWAGLKDRHAITEQWLSIHMPKSDVPDFSAFEKQYPSIEIIDVAKHNKKLRPGDLIGNYFDIILSETSNIEALEEKLQLVSQNGVPNYYGAQRFGKEGNNVEEAKRWGRDNVRTRNQNKRSMFLSSARSWIFNQIVSRRIEQGLFSTIILGDILNVAEQSTCVVEQSNLTQSQQHLEAGTAQITSALAGDNQLPTLLDALQLEQEVVDSEPDLMALIRGNRMRHDRRDIMLKPSEFEFQIKDDQIVLHFYLSSGSFATSITRELINEIPVERIYN